MYKPIKIVDLFAGPGGLGEGFSSVGPNDAPTFKIAVSVEKEASAHSTLTLRAFTREFKNRMLPYEYYQYLRGKITKEELITIYPKEWAAACNETLGRPVALGEDNKLIHSKINEALGDNSEPWVLIGGPPCQAYSLVGRAKNAGTKGYIPEDDDRHFLYREYLDIIKQFEPTVFVMENVKGMLPYTEQVVEDYKNIRVKKGNKIFSYSVDCKVLVSNDFGVAQKRQRLIFIAIRNDISEKRKITPSGIFQEIENTYPQNKGHVLRDALEYIKPLDAPRIKNMTELDDEITGKKVDVNQFYGNENSYLKLINDGRKIEYVFNHKARYTNDINYEIYGTLEQGEDGTSEKIKHVMPYKHRNHIFKDKYFKLIEDKPSRTITAHLKMDCHSHIHPRQVRSITPREAARIQSFPDDYVFLGAYLKTYMQIGNAVPPVMARGIAKVLKKYI